MNNNQNHQKSINKYTKEIYNQKKRKIKFCKKRKIIKLKRN